MDEDWGLSWTPLEMTGRKIWLLHVLSRALAKNGEACPGANRAADSEMKPSEPPDHRSNAAVTQQRD
jgi:hypothetical protein